MTHRARHREIDPATLLLLDEATSQLDAVNELALRDVIAELARETTVLVVAHRLSTVTGADRIVVMEAGWVRSSGTHEELVAQDRLYAQLAATQLVAPARRPTARGIVRSSTAAFQAGQPHASAPAETKTATPACGRPSKAERKDPERVS